MNAFTQLTTIASLSAGFIGFIALFVVLTDKDVEFSKADVLFIRMLVLAMLGALICSLLPGTLSLLMKQHYWSVAAAISVLVVLPGLILTIRHHLQLRRNSTDGSQTVWHIASYYTSISGLILFCVVPFINELQAGLFVLAVLAFFLTGVWAFVAMLFRRVLPT